MDEHDYLWRVFKLFRKASESFLLWVYLESLHSPKSEAHFNRMKAESHDLLNTIAYTSRTTALLCIDELMIDAPHTLNIFQLLHRAPYLEPRERFAELRLIQEVAPTAAKVSVLRSRLNTHDSSEYVWCLDYSRNTLSEEDTAKIDALLHAISHAITEVAHSAHQSVYSHDNIKNMMLRHYSRLLSSLEEYYKPSNKVGNLEKCDDALTRWNTEAED